MSSRPAILFRLLLAGILSAFMVACGSDKVQPVQAQDFYARRTPGAGAPISPWDQPGIIPLPDAHSQAPKKPPIPLPEPTASDLQPAPRPAPATQPAVVSGGDSTTQPSDAVSLALDKYMTLGSVVEVVNGTPIFANKVLRLNINVLRAKAKQMDIHHFEIAARAIFEETVHELTGNELEVAAAERTLDPKDIQLARALTHMWSQNQVAEAGGSEQVVRIRALASGESFEEQEQDYYRVLLQQLYWYRKINPQIDITAEDERRYYHNHIEEFTTPQQASIILIEADPEKLNGKPDAAKTKLQHIREHALAGEDFANFGRLQNDLPGAMGPQGNGGQMTLKPNSFVLTNVDAQIWETPVGHISDIIEDHDAFYIFKVISRDDGGTKPFADKAIQEAITKRLTDLQRNERRNAEMRKLQSEAIVSSNPNYDVVVEMALQNYPRWSKE